MEVGLEDEMTYPARCTVTISVTTPALKWAAMRAILMFH